MVVLQLNIGAKKLKLDIVFYSTFIDDVIYVTNWRKVDFEKKAVDVCKSEQSIGIQ